LCMASMLSYNFLRPMPRKCSSSRVRCSRSTKPLDCEAVGLRPADLGGAVLDLLELEEQLAGVAIGPAVELAPVAREHGVDPSALSLEGGQHVVVHQVDRGDRHLGVVRRPTLTLLDQEKSRTYGADQRPIYAPINKLDSIRRIPPLRILRPTEYDSIEGIVLDWCNLPSSEAHWECYT